MPGTRQLDKGAYDQSRCDRNCFGGEAAIGDDLESHRRGVGDRFAGVLHGGAAGPPRPYARGSAEGRRAIEAERGGNANAGGTARGTRSDFKDAANRSPDLPVLRVGARLWADF